MCMGTFAFADPCSVVNSGNSTNPAITYPNGGTDGYGNPLVPYAAGGTSTITSACGYVTPLSSDPTTARQIFTSAGFLATYGQAYLDTINWEVNPGDINNGLTGNGSYYSTSPAISNDLQGENCCGYPSPPYGGGVNGTGYTFGSVPSALNGDPLNLGLSNTFGTLPTFAQANILHGTASSGNDFALTWDTSTTGAHYDYNDPNQPNCDGQGSDIWTQSCWIPGVNTFAPITGLGFDIQLKSGQSVGPFSVTFNVYGATPGCGLGGADGNATVEGGSTLPTSVDCFDYNTGQMMDTDGNDNPTSPCVTADPDYSNCIEYSGTNVQLLGTITVNSDEVGDPAFLGFTTTDPYGIGALVMTNWSFGNASDNPDVNFAVDEQTLLTAAQPATPEPATLLLFGSGLLLAARRLRKRATK
jgi:hypothetical protein